ncbi:unnamed protein product, partial [Schistosoma turkestanicum]
SASAGPPSNRQDKLSVDEKSRLLPRIRVSDLRERGNDAHLDHSRGQEKINESNEMTMESSGGTDHLSVRRMNTFSMSDKVRPTGSESQSPNLKCPLSRAPPMSNIPNSLTTPTTNTAAATTNTTTTTNSSNSSDNSPIKQQSIDKFTSSTFSSSLSTATSPNKQNTNATPTPTPTNATFFEHQPIKLNKAVPYTEENP